MEEKWLSFYHMHFTTGKILRTIENAESRDRLGSSSPEHLIADAF